MMAAAGGAGAKKAAAGELWIRHHKDGEEFFRKSGKEIAPLDKDDSLTTKRPPKPAIIHEKDESSSVDWFNGRFAIATAKDNTANYFRADEASGKYPTTLYTGDPGQAGTEADIPRGTSMLNLRGATDPQSDVQWNLVRVMEGGHRSLIGWVKNTNITQDDQGGGRRSKKRRNKTKKRISKRTKKRITKKRRTKKRSKRR